jgi:soluble lytic murein transglycosylase-like protein
MLRLTWILVVAIPVMGGESAVLTSGMRLHIDRHEVAGGIVRLYRGDGVTEMPSAAVTAFEPDEVPPTVAAENSPAQPKPPEPAAKPALDPRTSDPRTMVRDAAARAGLPAAFVESVAKTESAFDPAAVSPKGAIGVMQLMPATAKALGADPTDPAQNIEAGARLLRELLLKYNGDVVRALAAYNAGEAAVDRYQGVPPYPETQHYVNSVVRDYLNASPSSINGTAPDLNGSAPSLSGTAPSGKGTGQ